MYQYSSRDSTKQFGLLMLSFLIYGSEGMTNGMSWEFKYGLCIFKLVLSVPKRTECSDVA